jgi:regulator of sirC expression with transglutaminase-like and TPR domain
MFFPRLRKQAKWMFVFLALAFAVGFVVFNVGSGGGGTGIGDLLLSPGGGTAQVSAKDARKAIAKNPNDATAYRDLATALESGGDTDGAIAALEQYSGRRPKDAEAKRELAGLYLSRAERLRSQANAAQLEAATVLAGAAFTPPSDSQLGQALGQDPITEAVQSRVNERLNDVYSRMQTEYRLALSVYEDIAALRPRDPTVQLELAQAAEASNDTEAALAAYEKFLKLAPEDPSAPAIRQRIEQLRSPAMSAG